MTRYCLVDKMLKQVGIPIVIRHPNSETEISCTACIQPLGYKGKPESNEIGSPTGFLDKNYYLYIGSAKYKIDCNSVVETDDKKYYVVKSQCLQLGRKPLYVRAILRTLPQEDANLV